MQIDAKTAKQLLELRYLNASGGGSTGGMDVNTNDTDELFQMMLDQNMGSSGDTSGSSITKMAHLLADGNATSVTGNTYGASAAVASAPSLSSSDPWSDFDQLQEVDPSNSTTTARLAMNGMGAGNTIGASGVDQAGGLSGLNGASADNGSKATQYNEFISTASSKYGIPESLIKAVIDVESSFNPNAGSNAGAKGLMQLMDGTAAGLGVSNSYDPAQNIDGGTKYLSYQLKRYDDNIKTALAAYNAGPGRLQRLGISNDQELMEKFSQLPKETQRYIGKIEAAQQKYAL